MNLPNKLTILRVIMIPFFVFFLLSGVGGSASKWIALVIFAAASITDTLDGYIARRDNLITDFGKFMDPLADKLLVCSALICFVELDKLPAWMLLLSSQENLSSAVSAWLLRTMELSSQQAGGENRKQSAR